MSGFRELVWLRAATMLLGAALVSSGCTSGDPGGSRGGGPQSSSSVLTSTAPSTPRLTRSPGEGSSGAPSSGQTVSPSSGAVPSLRDLADLAVSTQPLQVGEVVLRTPTFERMRILFHSGDRTISGTLTRPIGDGPFPAVVSSHGYLSPETYRVGDGMFAEENALGRAGYVVLHPDLTGYGTSSPATALEAALGLVYAEDIVNGVEAVKSLPYVDAQAVALIGRSLGAGLSLDVVVSRPDLVRAVVLLSPVSSRFERALGVLDRVGADASATVEAAFGSPPANPDFYAGMSSRTYFDDVDVPVLVQHGTADPLCAFGESERTVALLDRAGVPAQLRPVPGQRHIYRGRAELASITASIVFLDALLRS